MQGFWLRGYFYQKASKNESLHPSFSWLTILGKQLSKSRMVEIINLASNKINHHHCFLFLLYVIKGLSSLNGCEKWMIRIEFFNLVRGNLNTRMEPRRVTDTTFPLSFRVVDQGHPLEYRGPWTTERSQVVAAIALTMCPWERSQEGEGKVHSPIQSCMYRLPYSRHMVSTFKNLTTVTTHRDLSMFRYIDGASIININIINSPACRPYDSNISKQTTPISREWQAITRLLPKPY
jgi:hypothetical protein